jgi:hypothetical protein
VHVLGSSEEVEASPFLPRAQTCETGKSGKSNALRDVHSMHSMPIDQHSDKVEALGDGNDANDADAEDEAAHLESLYKSMVKQQEWLGAEILRIKQRLHTRVHSKSMGNLSGLQAQVEAARGAAAQGAFLDGQVGPDGAKRQKRYKAFRDDTAINVGHDLGGKGLASRMLSEPEAQSVGPMMERSIEREKSDRVERGMRRSASRTGLKKQGLDDDQLSLCVPGEPWDRDPVSRSRGSSPLRRARSPTSPRFDCQGSPLSPRSREEVTTNDSVDMQRQRTGSKRNVTGNQSQYNSGKSSHEVLPTRPRLELGRGDRSQGFQRCDRDHGDQRDDRNRRDCQDGTGYYRSTSGSCPDLFRAHGGSIQSLHHHRGPSSDVYPGEYAHQSHRSFSPPPSQMMGPGMHGVPQMQGMQMQAMPFSQMQSMSMPYGQMQPLHPMHPMQMQHMQYIPQQFPRSCYGGMQMEPMQQPMMQMVQPRLQPLAAPNSMSGQAAATAALQNVLSEASKIQEIMYGGQKKSKARGKIQKKPTYESHNDNNLCRRESGDAKVPTDSLTGTPRAAQGPSDVSEPPLGDIHDLNLTPEELDTLFEDLDLPNLG